MFPLGGLCLKPTAWKRLRQGRFESVMYFGEMPQSFDFLFFITILKFVHTWGRVVLVVEMIFLGLGRPLHIGFFQSRGMESFH